MEEKKYTSLIRLRMSAKAYGEITHIGNPSRKMKLEARKVAVPRPDISDSAADFLAEPIVVAVAEGTCVTPKKCQRIPH